MFNMILLSWILQPKYRYVYRVNINRQEAENLNEEISGLKDFSGRFRNDNEEYNKIKKTVEEVSKLLTVGKVLLQFALASVIEALRINPDKYNNPLVSNTSSSPTTIHTQQSL
jgi:hypothetical protein